MPALGVLGSRQKHSLPDLPYDYGALEPHINAQIMQLHHSKHHAAYVNNLNVAEEKYREALEKGGCRAAGLWEAGGEALRCEACLVKTGAPRRRAEPMRAVARGPGGGIHRENSRFVGNPGLHLFATLCFLLYATLLSENVVRSWYFSFFRGAQLTKPVMRELYFVFCVWGRLWEYDVLTFLYRIVITFLHEGN